MLLDKEGRSLNERLGQARLTSRDTSELIGVCKGCLADGVVNLQEAMFILHWLEDHRSLTKLWPASELYQLLDTILEDGQISSAEESTLLGTLSAITGHSVKVRITISDGKGGILDATEKTMNTSTSLPINEPEKPIDFSGQHVVLTGTFEFGNREDCHNALIGAGGIPQKGVTKTTKYLVIGDIGNESWAQSSFGRKIEKAVFMRDSGHEIYILSESKWKESLAAL